MRGLLPQASTFSVVAHAPQTPRRTMRGSLLSRDRLPRHYLVPLNHYVPMSKRKAG
jgi:hypothetical protein